MGVLDELEQRLNIQPLSFTNTCVKSIKEEFQEDSSDSTQDTEQSDKNENITEQLLENLVKDGISPLYSKVVSPQQLLQYIQQVKQNKANIGWESIYE